MRTGFAVTLALLAVVTLAGCGDENLSFCDGCSSPTATPTLTPSPTPTSTVPTPSPTPTSPLVQGT